MRRELEMGSSGERRQQGSRREKEGSRSTTGGQDSRNRAKGWKSAKKDLRKTLVCLAKM